MEEELLKHLINLLRYSTQVKFKIPKIFFNEKFADKKQNKEIEEAWTYLKKDIDLRIYKRKTDKDLITVKIKVKQPSERKTTWESQ